MKKVIVFNILIIFVFLFFNFIYIQNLKIKLNEEIQKLNNKNASENIVNDVQTNPIDYQLEKCIANDNTNSGMIHCIQIGINEWDKEINKNLKTLQSILTKEQYESVQKSQIAWEKYRKEEKSSLKNLIYNRIGRYFQVSFYEQQLNLTEDRAKELEYYIYIYSEYGNQETFKEEE